MKNFILQKNNCLAEIEVLQRFGLLYWKTALLAFESKWFSIKDLTSFAFACIESNIADSDYRVALIASGTHYKSDIDFHEVLMYLAKNETIDDLVAEEIWIFSRLVAVKESYESDDIKYEELQDIIESAHQYPPILHDCYRYRKPSDILPFDAMNNTIEYLHAKLEYLNQNTQLSAVASGVFVQLK
jgi:hypothetical protein